ncbi:FG-GAP-like repeat-containing protein [Flavobacterium soli]|uniref:FG-GAP-like repeat-containing protein n=1 Tax=Flavobacterium soli TaxID=344881 RepID=UPI00041EDE5C|nr:FG-GAP-like repeat-containing protein [Flavobacterium soli]
MKEKLLLFLVFLTNLVVYGQNTCDTALPVQAGITVIDAINGSQAPSPFCVTGGTVATAGEWYVYSPIGNHTVTVTTDLNINIGDDPRVHIYKGDCTNLVCVAGDDDSGTLGNPDALCVVTFDALAGNDYFIAFDNKWDASGITFKLIENEYIPQPVAIVSFTQQTVGLTGSYRDCVVDMNGDYLDDIVSVSNGQVQMLLQTETGSFQSVTRPTPTTNFLPSWSIAAGDINKDGYNDLVYGNGQGVAFMRQNSTQTGFELMTSPEYVFSQRTNFIDIDNDGNLDAFVCHDVAPNVRYINDGTGNLIFAQGGMGDYPSGGNYGSIFVDYDNDGDMDLFIAKCGSGPIDELHQNNGDGTFTDVSIAAGMAEPSQSWSSAWADYDNDGDMDAMIGASSNTSGGHKLRLNNGDGTFTDVTAGSGLDVFLSTNIENVAHDFDNDGFVDLFMGGNTIMINNGNMTFTPNPVNTSVGSIGDLNNDGFLDVQYNNNIFLNTGNDNNWLKVHLEGVDSNRNGIGARIELYGTWGKQIREVRSGDGFRHMSSLNTHFGIGTAETITKLVVKWPSGIVDEILNPNINESILVVESSTLGVASTKNNAFILYPNPASEVLNIQNNSFEIEAAMIYDITGRKVVSTKNNVQSLDVHALSAGTYVVILRDTDGKTHTQKFIKK